MRIAWLRDAAASLDLEYEYLARKNPRAARHVFKRIVAATERLPTFPSSGREGEIPGTRELVITHLPYIVDYRITDDTVEILRVFHAATDWPRQGGQLRGRISSAEDFDAPDPGIEKLFDGDEP